jgi:hypothetical protein
MISEEIYQKTKEILRVYNSVIWNIEEQIEDLDKQSQDLIGEDLAFAVEILDKFDYRLNKDKLDDQLYDLCELRYMVDTIAKALIKVKSYPRKGYRYFDILQKNYLVKFPYSEDEILTSLDISKSTYYRQRKEAIKLLGYCLFNMNQTKEYSIKDDTRLGLVCD